MLQYFISTHGARKGLADTALKTANSGYLTRRLVDVAQDVIITKRTAARSTASRSARSIEGGEIIEPIGERILGRVALEDIRDPFTERGARRGQRGDRRRQGPRSSRTPASRRVKIRSVLTCEARRGVCTQVLRPRSGARPPRQHGRGGRRDRRAVDRRAGHPADDADVPHRRHGEPARGADDARITNDGKVRFMNLRTVSSARTATVVDEPQRRDRDRRQATEAASATRALSGRLRRARLKKKDGSASRPGELLAEWDPYTTPILSEIVRAW